MNSEFFDRQSAIEPGLSGSHLGQSGSYIDIATDVPPYAPGVILSIRLLGRISATDRHGIDVLPRGRKARALLAILALAAPAPILREQACQLLWSRRDREQARASLRQSIHELQESLARLGRDVLIIERGLLRLQRDAIRLDMDSFNDEDPPARTLPRATLLEDLTGLDQGFDRWLEEQRRKITRQIVQRAENVLARPDSEPGSPRTRQAAEYLLDLDPAHEAAGQALIRLHILHGKRAAALQVFDALRAALLVAGLTPSAETVELVADLRGGLPSTPTNIRPPAIVKRIFRLGVLPFRTLDGGTEDGLAAGLADELTTALSRFRWFFLVASPSLAAVASEPRDGSARWQSLDLDFLVEGMVRHTDDRVRISARLLDLRAGGEVVWAVRFDRVGTDIMSLQDDIAAVMVAQIDPQLLLHAGRGSAARPGGSLSAYEQVLSTIPALYRLEKGSFVAAGATLRQAIAADPSYAGAYSWLAYWHVFMVGQGWAADHGATLDQAGQLAQHGVALDPSDARAHAIAGHVRDMQHLPTERSLDFHQRALSLNPNLPIAWGFAGLAQSLSGDQQEAIRMIRHAMTLSPFDPQGFYFEAQLMMPYLLLRDFDAAAELGRRSIALNPALSSTYKGLLSALGHLGRSEEAAAVRQHLDKLEPGFSLSVAARRSPLRRAADIAIYLDGLRAGGLQD